MRVTPRQLNRATLERQLLLRREPFDVGEAVRRVVALQAQEPPSPYLALWSRLADFRPADLETALAERVLVKATLMRITLHLVHTDDYPTMHLAMQPTLRGARLGDARFTSTGLTAAEADKLVPEVLDYLHGPRSNADLETWLGERLGVPAKRVWWALRSYAPVRHAVTGGPWSFGQRPAYVVSDSRGFDREAAPDDHLPGLVRRYLDGFGPASVADIAQFAMVQRARVRRALEPLGNRLERLVGPDSMELYDVPGGPSLLRTPPRLPDCCPCGTASCWPTPTGAG